MKKKLKSVDTTGKNQGGNPKNKYSELRVKVSKNAINIPSCGIIVSEGDVMLFITAKEIAERWQISDKRVRVLCRQGRISGAKRGGWCWYVPFDAVKPQDLRIERKLETKSGENPFAEADYLKRRLYLAKSLDYDRFQELDAEFRIIFAHDAAAMSVKESVLTYDECAEILCSGCGVANKDLTEQLKIRAIDAAWSWLNVLAVGDAPSRKMLKESLVLRVHDIISMGEDTARHDVYRKRNTFFPSLRNFPSRGRDVQRDMKLLLENYQKKTAEHPVAKIVRFHLDFETVRPFENGNGRTGQLLVNFELKKAGYLPVIFRLEDKERYFNAFDTYRDGGGAADMENLFAERLTAEYRKHLKIVRLY